MGGDRLYHPNLFMYYYYRCMLLLLFIAIALLILFIDKADLTPLVHDSLRPLFSIMWLIYYIK